MTNCLSRLFCKCSNKTEILQDFKTKKNPPLIKSPLIKLTNNFYCLKRKGRFWTVQQTSVLSNLINYKLFYPIPKDFVGSIIFGSFNIEEQLYEGGPKMILFNFDIKQNNKHSLRGIACVSDDLEENNLILDLIGNISIKNKLASSIKKKYCIETKSGKDIIEYLKKYASEKKYEYLTLNSMEYAIGFYWKYGWRFKKYNENNENNENRNTTIWTERIKKLNTIMLQTDDGDEERDKILLKYFDRFLPGYYNDKQLSYENTWSSDHSDYGILTTLERQRWELRFHGYPMFWKC